MQDCAKAVAEEILERRELGIKNYGKTVNSADATEDWVDHLTSELLDAIVYAKAVKERDREQRQRISELEVEVAKLKEQQSPEGKFLIPNGRRYTDPRSLWERLPRIANFDFDAGMVYPEEAQAILELKRRLDDFPELEHQLAGLQTEADLYRRGYEKIGACDISNYLALCENLPQEVQRLEVEVAKLKLERRELRRQLIEADRAVTMATDYDRGRE